MSICEESSISLVLPDRWIVANCKESQLAGMAPGEAARFAVDALGSARLTGRIEQISPAAGSEFAVLKPDRQRNRQFREGTAAHRRAHRNRQAGPSRGELEPSYSCNRAWRSAYGAKPIARTLLIEDDTETALYVTEGLQQIGHVVVWAATGPDGLFQASHGDYELIVADRMLPGLDGLSLVRNLRGADIQTPVLFLTTMDGLDARVEGLEGGGDDYLAKPFAMPELAARANALVRRAQHLATLAQTRLVVADLEIDLLTRAVERAGKPIELQPQEFKLLEFLMQNSGKVVTRRMLLERVWGLDFDPGTTVLESHMSRLRAKVDRGFGAELIHTIRGYGYMIRAS